MRPLPLWPVRNQRRGEAKLPVPLTSSHGGGLSRLLAPSGDEAQLKAMGGNGTLFAIIDAYTTAMAGTDWHLYEKLPAGAPEDAKRPVVDVHPALDLWNHPTGLPTPDWQPPYDQSLFVATLTQHLELVGVAYAVVVKIGRLPYELWPVLPHRVEPVPDPNRLIAGYLYHGPDGQTVPLGTGDVIRMVRTPCPWDQLRGVGAVQTVLRRLQSAAAAEEWHRQFFLNSARPDGVITVPVSLGPTEWEEFQQRWKETHQGVLNAHRVAILEHGAEWKPTAYSPHDMQFVELDRLDSEKIREAYRMSETVLGRGETLNRATAEAQMFQFAANHVVPRLKAVWKKGFLNGRLLPMYGPTGVGVEFDFVSPVEEDKEARDRNIVAQSTAYKNYVDAGVDPADEAMLRHLGLPKMTMAPKPEPPALPPTSTRQSTPVEPASARLELVLSAPGWDTAALAPAHTSNGHGHHHNGHGRQVRPALPRAADDDEDVPDLSGVRTDLEAALKRLDRAYQPTLDQQIDSLVQQVEEAIDADDLDALKAISIPDDLHGADVVQRALEDMARTAADRAVDEVAAEDVTVDPDDVAEELEGVSELGVVAAATAAAVAASLALSAVREARRLYRPGVDGAEVAGRVRTYLEEELAGAGREAEFGGELQRATNLGRVSVFTVALRVRPNGIITAHEQNDLRTCPRCAEINGHVFPEIESAMLLYGGGGYVDCQGKWRCRGTIHISWS